MAEDPKPWEMCERPDSRSIKRTLYFLREYCPKWSDRLTFENVRKITLHERAFAMVQWDECDVPTFWFQEPQDNIDHMQRVQQRKKAQLLRSERETILWKLEESCLIAIGVLRELSRVDRLIRECPFKDLDVSYRCLLSAKLLECSDEPAGFSEGGYLISKMTFTVSPEGWGLLNWLDDVEFAKARE